MRQTDIYKRLARHLSQLGMGYPPTEDLQEILRANFAPKEVEVAMALPTGVIPLQPVGVDEILRKLNLPRLELEQMLGDLANKGLLFSGMT